MRTVLLVVLALLVFPVTNAAAQSTVPVLRYSPPANANQIGTGLPDDYTFTGFNAMKVTVNTIGGGLYNKPALHYYLFSADGRVYRAYDFPPVAAANIELFDFDGAERTDRMNSGR
jgi:hypothetical protein